MSGRLPLLAAAGGLLAGTALTAVVAVTDVGGGDGGERLRGEAAAEAFVAAWERSRLSTWAIEGTFVRTTAAGRRIESAIQVAQRPPDRLSVGLGSVEARRGDRRLACTTGPDDRLHCRDAGGAVPYRVEVRDEVARLREYVGGPAPLYDVAGGGDGCFDLRLTAPGFPAPPYGERARFCFDEATGAPTLAEVHRKEATDVRRTDEVRADVRDEDLAPPPGEAG